MRRLAIALSLLSLLAPLAAGCDSTPLEIGDVAAEYVLESINGDPLPTRTYGDGVISFTLLADTLRLEADRGGSQVSVHRTDWTDPAKADEVSATTGTLTYRLRGERIEVSFFCPPNALCVDGPHLVGRLDEGTLVVEDFNGNLLRYRRAGS